MLLLPTEGVHTAGSSGNPPDRPQCCPGWPCERPGTHYPIPNPPASLYTSPGVRPCRLEPSRPSTAVAPPRPSDSPQPERSPRRPCLSEADQGWQQARARAQPSRAIGGSRRAASRGERRARVRGDADREKRGRISPECHVLDAGVVGRVRNTPSGAYPTTCCCAGVSTSRI